MRKQEVQQQKPQPEDLQRPHVTEESRGERPVEGRAELRALKEVRHWPNADERAELIPIPDASRMRPGCVRILKSGKFRRILAENRQNLSKSSTI